MSQSIIELIKKRLESSKSSIPVFHAVALRLQQLLARNDFKVEELSMLISADAGLASKVLRVANSSFYAGLTKVNTIQEAFIRLGSHEVANIVMVTTQEDLYRSSDPHYNTIMQSLWKHSFCSAVASKWLANRAGLAAIAQEAFLAGLLHDIGKLFLLKVMEDLVKTGVIKGGATTAIIDEVFDNLHVEQGYLLMKSWLMPEVYCEIIRDHENEEWNHSNQLLAVVRLADHGCRVMGVGLRAEPQFVLFTSPEAQSLGLKEVALAELEIVIEDAVKMPMAALR
ncbi:HDOD domain-containing protein [Geomesophilobacter sediminis]|uniref:HDOD domain-containing protein n=1 Tax=Geomesophilobacter sediminis TaxID=2798584 RepID=A0A8J7M365_9BACT|nr:HDOD domain-containing protein [Geomesophilobacter sediminis]MBJ6727576.1 HDOD domain-containing protein [Geomesophilobacter sediminis]